MVRRALRAVLAGMVFGLVALSAATTAEAAHPDIFYNFYQGPTIFCAGQPAELYVSPRPTPPLVGHTWITYPPLMPNEFMYHHHRKYYKYYRNGGYTTSCVRYSSCWW